MGGSQDRPGGDAPAEAQIRTFLIADVRGYTSFTQLRGDEAAGQLAARFADTVRTCVEARGGTLLELRGDEALCVFSSAREAIRAAVELQQRFVQATVDRPDLPLTVGIGLDAGEAVPVEGGYRGAALNLAARLCGVARAGEILATREVTHLARRIDGAAFVDRGSLTLKGIADSVVVVRVMPDGEDPVERLRPFAQSPSRSGGRRPRRRVLLGGLATVVVTALVLGAVAIPRLAATQDPPVQVGAESIARLSTVDGAATLATPLGGRPGASAIGFDALWVTQPDRGTVARLDLEDGSVSDTIRVGAAPAGITTGDGAVWVANSGDGTVSRIDPGTNEVTDTIRVGTSPAGIAFGEGVLWVAETIGAALLRVDPTSHAIETTELDGRPADVAYTPDGVWVSMGPNAVARVDPSDRSVTFTQPVGNGPSGVAAAFGSIWVANHLDGTVSRLEPSTGRGLAVIPVRDGPNDLVAAGGRLWVANEFDGSVVAIDPTTNAVDRTTSVGGAAAALAGNDEDLWLATGTSSTEHLGGTLVVATGAHGLDTLDPALTYDMLGWQILTMTNDGLLAYEKVGGPEGATLVPDLAAALPQVSSDGLTYRFPLRDGITYSTGAPIAPEDFRRGLERAIGLNDAPFLYGAIVGADRCRDARQACDLSDSIVVDAASVTIRLARPDGELPFKLAMPFAFPVPAGTPMEDQGTAALPATGPYMIESVGSAAVQLVRNPHFEEWSAAAQPNGFVDAVSLRFGLAGTEAFSDLQAGRVDVMLDPPPSDDIASLRVAHPDQVVVWPNFSTLYVGFDVRKAPFDDVRVRQALNLAIDREHIVDLLGGDTVQRPSCQILPPTFQGHAPFCPYTLDPGQGTWTAPDLERARTLMTEAGAAGAEVVALVSDEPVGWTDVMRYVVEVLNDLGMRATLKTVSGDPGPYFETLYTRDAPDHPQLFIAGWVSDYPAAGNFLQPQFGCTGFANASGLCDEALDAAMQEALGMFTSRPGAADRAWIDIEHRLVDEAAQAPVAQFVTTTAVSDRTGNVQVSPQWGILLSRLWVE